ncbi:hypothetical protein I4U23_011486 [Adineta vaga]|nr:hypothetical protein I4U23_011486 [Adineta vaga]
MVPGETLFILAFKYGVTVDEIIALNPPVNSINRMEKQAWFQHTVISGATTSNIARKHAVLFESIITANLGIQPDALVPGQKIQVPVSVRQGFWFLTNCQLQEHRSDQC